MAKLTARTHKYNRIFQNVRKSKVDISVRRATEDGRLGPFYACLRMRPLRGRDDGTGSKAVACAYGRNPRHALAAAARKWAKQLGRRKGAFRGLK